MTNRTEYLTAVYQSGLDADAKALAAYLAYRKNFKENGRVFPSIDTMRRETSLSRSTVMRRLSILKRTGWVVSTGDTKGQGVRVYDLAVGRTETAVGLSDTDERQADTSGRSAGHTEQGREQDKELDREQVKTGAAAPVVKEDLLSRKGSQSAKPGAIAPPSTQSSLMKADPAPDAPLAVTMLRRLLDGSLTGTEDEGLVQKAHQFICDEQPEWHANGPTWWNDRTITKVKVAVGLEEGW